LTNGTAERKAARRLRRTVRPHRDTGAARGTPQSVALQRRPRHSRFRRLPTLRGRVQTGEPQAALEQMLVSEAQRASRRWIRLAQRRACQLLQLRARSASSGRSGDAAAAFSFARASASARGVLSPSSATLPAQDDLSRRRALQPRHARGAAVRASDTARSAEAQLFAQPVAPIGIFQPLLHDLRTAQTAVVRCCPIGSRQVETRLETVPRATLAGERILPTDGWLRRQDNQAARGATTTTWSLTTARKRSWSTSNPESRRAADNYVEPAAPDLIPPLLGLHKHLRHLAQAQTVSAIRITPVERRASQHC
jgi:hypothetical protein